MKYKAYAGIGSRMTPPAITDIMFGFAKLAEDLNWTLRSGGAQGADKAFEMGVTSDYMKEIFLPWGAFNGNKSLRTHPSYQALLLAEELLGSAHWGNLTQGAKKLHARNVHQVLGQTLHDPVQFVICWTPEGREVGGTATALKLARMHNIPIFNLGTTVDEDRLEKILKG